MFMLPSLVCWLLSLRLVLHSFRVNAVAPGIQSVFKSGKRKDRQSQPHLSGFIRQAKTFPENSRALLTSHQLEFCRMPTPNSKGG